MGSVVEFKGPDWGKSIHHGVEAGATLGKGINAAIASVKYSNAKAAANEAFEKDITAAGNDQKAIDLAHSKRDQAMGNALSEVQAFTGEYGKAHDTQRQTDQEAALAEFKRNLQNNSAYYDKDITDDLSTDTIAKITRTKYSIGDDGNLNISQNGKLMQSMPITNEMRAPFLKNLQDMKFGSFGGGGVLQDDNTAAAGSVGAMGPTEPAADNGGRSYRDQYNTKLSEKDEAEYQKWAKRTGRDADEEDYDMRGAWLEAKKKGVSLEDEKGHFPDKYKKPNHPTFSNESKYNGAEGAKGGTWGKTADGRDMYTPGRDLSDEEAQKLQKYFAEREPNAVLNLQGRQSQQRPQAMITADNAPQQSAGQQQAMELGPDAVMRRQRPEGYMNDMDFVIRRERELAQIQDRFLARYGRYPTGMEKSKILDALQQQEVRWHNAQTEDHNNRSLAETMRNNRETNAISRGNLAMRQKEFEFKQQQEAAKQLADQVAKLNPKLEISDTGDEENGYAVKNEQGMTVGTLFSIPEKGKKGSTAPVIAPPGWSKERVVNLIDELRTTYGNTRGVEYETDPSTLHTTIKIGDNVFGYRYGANGELLRTDAFRDAEQFLAEVQGEVAEYKGSAAHQQDKIDKKKRRDAGKARRREYWEGKNREELANRTKDSPWKED